MTIMNGDTFVSVEKGLRAVFNSVYQLPIDNEWQKISAEMSSNGPSEKYGFMGNTASMREFLSERIPAGLQGNTFEITNKKFESTLAFDRDAIADDRYGQFVILIKNMGDVARRYYGERAWEIFFEGDQTTYGQCYDGLEFFDTQHKEGTYYTTVQSNLLTSAFSQAGVSAARLAMRNFRDDRGKKLGIVGDTLVVPPELEDDAMKLTKSPTVDASGNINPNQGRYNVIVRPEITDTDSWALISTSSFIKPLIFQNREPTEFGSTEPVGGSGQNEGAFMREKWYYGVRNRFNFGYWDWRRAIMCVP